MVRFLPLAAPLALFALATAAEAQIVHYEFTGAVTDPQFADGMWTTVMTGDPITVIYSVDATAIPTFLNPEFAQYADCLVGFSLQRGGRRRAR